MYVVVSILVVNRASVLNYRLGRILIKLKKNWGHDMCN